MADDATVVSQVTVLPDEIAQTISTTTTVSPADANDKWYYKLSAVNNTSSDLITGYFTDYTAVDSSTAPTAIASGDKVKFLYVKNTDSTNAVYIVLDAGTASASEVDALYIGAGQSLAIQCPNATVADVHAVSSTGTVNCIVAALLDDVA